MTIEQQIASAFHLNDENWMRHANPASVWTRFTVLPLLILAFWSRAWLGWWALIPIALAVAWTFLNPLVFPRARTTTNWASKGVLGERVWASRDNVPVPEHHRRAPNILNALAGIGMILVIWGVIAFSIWPTVTGTVIAVMFKVWYVDRMVWLFEDMKHLPEYAKWLY